MWCRVIQYAQQCISYSHYDVWIDKDVMYVPTSLNSSHNHALIHAVKALPQAVTRRSLRSPQQCGHQSRCAQRLKLHVESCDTHNASDVTYENLYPFPSTLTYTHPPSSIPIHPLLYPSTLTYTHPPSPIPIHPHLYPSTLYYTHPPSPTRL
jgi:hypothetical protein